MRHFGRERIRQLIVERLNDLPIDSLWIKVSQSGTLTHAAVRNLVNGAVDFHSLGMPLVGDMMGGLRERSALAFGAYGGICHRVTQKERFNASSWTRPGEFQQVRLHLASKDLRS